MCLIFILDRWSKVWVISHIARSSIKVLPFMRFTYAENTGVAFGFLYGNNAALLVITIVLVLCAIFFRKEYLVPKSFLSSLGFWLILSGGFGNIYDRISYGFVVDFIDFSFFPAIFNVADSAITVGTAIICIDLFLDEKRKKKAKKNILAELPSAKKEGESL